MCGGQALLRLLGAHEQLAQAVAFGQQVDVVLVTKAATDACRDRRLALGVAKIGGNRDHGVDDPAPGRLLGVRFETFAWTMTAFVRPTVRSRRSRVSSSKVARVSSTTALSVPNRTFCFTELAELSVIFARSASSTSSCIVSASAANSCAGIPVCSEKDLAK